MSAWIVGYLPKDAPKEELTISTDFVWNQTATADIVVDNLKDWEYYKYTNLNSSQQNFNPTPQQITYEVYFAAVNQPDKRGKVSFKNNGEFLGSVATGQNIRTSLLCAVGNVTHGSTVIRNFIEGEYAAGRRTNLDNYTLSYLANFIQSPSAQEDFLALDGQTITDGALTYQIKVEKSTSTLGYTTFFSYGSNPAQYMFGQLSNKVPDATYDEGTFRTILDYAPWTLTLTQVTDKLTVTLPANDDRLHLEDAPYDMFCIPYHQILCDTANDGRFRINTAASLAIANAIALTQEESNSTFDLQLLPYCPVQEIMSKRNSGLLDTTRYPAYLVKDSSGSACSVVVYAKRSNFTVDIPFEEPAATTAVELKVQSECDKLRLVSPTNNGAFDINVAKNGGITTFHSSCAYRPFKPFIHVRPNFGRLYGSTSDTDPRGLVCGGDFSLPRMSDAWQQYQYNNKNYQEIFNRQIENLDVQNKYQATQDIMNAITGTIGGITGGAMSGAFVGGGPVGGAIGGVVGGISATAAGLADISINQSLRDEAKDYTKDLYGYQLGNIKAMSQSLVNTGSLTPINCMFPYLERYTCSYAEKEALRNKIKYNGMTVMRIGTIAPLLQTTETYIKGKLIRLEIDADTHITQTIANELNQGVFIKQEVIL